MSVFGKIFGSDEALAKVVDTASGLLDEAFYTDQEEAADREAVRAKAQGMVIEWMAASTGSRLARRIIALAITGAWLGAKLIATVVTMIGAWVGVETTEKLRLTAETAQQSAQDMTPAVMLILGFYFAAPYMGELAKGALEKFSQNNSQK